MSTLAEYYRALPSARAARLQQIEARIFSLFPAAAVSLKYKMPTFETANGWLAIGNQKHHCALYTCKPEHIQSYIDACPSIDHGKGCLRFRDSHELAIEAIDTVVQSALG
ncbi:MAG: iron chaperone [Opitutaceae bacterium]